MTQDIYVTLFETLKKELVDLLDKRADTECRFQKARNKLLRMAWDNSLPEEIRSAARAALAGVPVTSIPAHASGMRGPRKKNVSVAPSNTPVR